MIELLESRIAPANIAITTTPDGGYNIVGTDSPDELRIEGIEPGVIQIRNENGTVTVNGSEEVTVANLPVPRGLVMIDLAGGDDFALLISLNFRRDLIINLGDGADLLSINELNVARTLRISGGAGSDQLIVGQTITVGRDLEVDLGLGMFESWTVTSSIKHLVVKGDLIFRSAADEVHFHSGGATLPTESFVHGMDPLTRFRVNGEVRIEFSAPGSHHIAIAATDIHFGSLNIVATSGTSDVIANIRSLGAFKIPRGFTGNFAGGGDLEFNADTITIGRSFTVLNGSGDYEFEAITQTSLRLPHMVLDLGDGSSDIRLNSRGKFSGKSIQTTAGTGSDSFFIFGKGKLAGPTTLNFGAGNASSTITGNELGPLVFGRLYTIQADRVFFGAQLVNFNGGVTLQATENTTSNISFDSVISNGPVQIVTGSGNDMILFDAQNTGATRPSVFKKAVFIDVGTGIDTVRFGVDSASVIGSPGRLTFNQRVDLDHLAFGSTLTFGPSDEVNFKKGLFRDGNEVTLP